MERRTTLWVPLCVFAVSCVDAPEPRPPIEEEPVRYPGYCVAQTELDGDADPEGERVAFYDEDGTLLRDEFDSDLDGDADVLTAYAYDDEGRRIREEVDRYADGELDEVREYQWEENRLTVETWDEAADGTIDITIEYTHDEDGRPVRGTGQRDEDEDPEMTLRFEYGSNGLLLALYVDGYYDILADGEWDRIIFFAYDEAGNQSVAGYDVDANGFVDLVVTFFYDCWM